MMIRWDNPILNISKNPFENFCVIEKKSKKCWFMCYSHVAYL